MLSYFKDLKICDKFGKDMTKKLKCIKGWQITIQGVISLFEDLKTTVFKYLLNQDSFKNSFGYIRQQGGNALGPTPIQFSKAFKKIIGLNFFHHSGNINCESDSFESLNLFSNWSKFEIKKLQFIYAAII